LGVFAEKLGIGPGLHFTHYITTGDEIRQRFLIPNGTRDGAG